MAQINQVNAFETSKYLTTIIEPKPIKRVSPLYPINAARNNREGWATLSFVIGKDGYVSNVLVTETSGSKDFANAAKKAVSKWQYQPAFENGEAIQQCVNTIKMYFTMNGNRPQGVSRRFKSKYNKAIAAFESKNYAELEAILVSMQETRYMHILENDYMHLLAADYAKIKQDQVLQLHHLTRSTFSSDSKQQANKLYRTFFLQVELQKFRAAHRTYKILSKLDAAETYMPQLKEIMTKVDDFIGSKNELVIEATIKEQDYWSIALVRNEFSLVNVKGTLDKLDIRCANKRHVYTVEENNSWKIPASWKNCSIFVFGEPNTSFSLVEFPIKS